MEIAGNLSSNGMPPKLDEGSDTERVQIVAPASWVARVEEWRRAQERIPSRSEAIRLLVDAGLDIGRKNQKDSAKPTE